MVRVVPWLLPTALAAHVCTSVCPAGSWGEKGNLGIEGGERRSGCSRGGFLGVKEGPCPVKIKAFM